MKTPEQLQTDILAIINNPNLNLRFSSHLGGLSEIEIFKPLHPGPPYVTIYKDTFLWHTYSVSVNYHPVTVTSAKKLWQAAEKRIEKDKKQEIDEAIQYLAHQ